jgi:hypothetical protein
MVEMAPFVHARPLHDEDGGEHQPGKGQGQRIERTGIALPNHRADGDRNDGRNEAHHCRADAGNVPERLHCQGVQVAEADTDEEEADHQIAHEQPERRHAAGERHQ